MRDDNVKKSMRCENKFENNNELIPPDWEHEKKRPGLQLRYFEP